MPYSLLISIMYLISMIGTIKTKHFWHFTCFLDFYMGMFTQFRLEICGGNCPTIPAYMFLFLPPSLYIIGGGGYTYLLEPLWWAGLITSMFTLHKVSRGY